ncbi:hypothetical protein LTR93_012297 [Exophiala xenobiotica]|nr:hypothetical protein LTR93_012297 [Exophiala xenobiotica]
MPTSIRATGVGVSYMTQHILIIVLAQVTPLALQDIAWRYFISFVASSAIFAIDFYVSTQKPGITHSRRLRQSLAIEVLALFLHINDEQVGETIDEAGDNIRKEGLLEKASQVAASEHVVHSEDAVRR